MIIAVRVIVPARVNGSRIEFNIDAVNRHHHHSCERLIGCRARIDGGLRELRRIPARFSHVSHELAVG